MSIKEKDRKARANYKRTLVTLRVELYGTDNDIKTHIESVKQNGLSVQRYIKNLIRQDMSGK